MKKNLSHFTRSFLATSLFLSISFGSAQAQVPAVPAAFPNVPQTPGTLLYRSTGDANRVTNIIYHNGKFYTNTVTGASQTLWDFSNPSDVTTFGHRGPVPTLFNDQGNHAHTKIGDYVVGFFNGGITRQSLGVNVITDGPPEFDTLTSTANDGHVLNWPWKTPFHWIQYSGTSNTPTKLIRPRVDQTGPQVLWSWNSLAEDGVTGNSILLGNLLFITSDGSNLGVLCYDISPVFRTPAERPVLLDKLTGAFGAYIAAPFENYIVLTDGNNNKVEVIDWSDPTDLKHVASINVKSDRRKEGEHNVDYVQAQDNFIFAQRHKINMDNFTPVLELSQTGFERPAGSVAGNIDTSQYKMPIGNLLVTGGYSFGDGYDRVGIWAHQAAPDTKKPYVGYHMPRPGQTNFPLGAPISLLIHETLESFTIVNGVSVIVREVGTTTPLNCWTSFSHDDVLTITPKQYLLPNKTYEVLVVDGLIKDAVGNGIEPYSFTFSTGSSASGGNASPIITAFQVSPSPTTTGANVTLTVAATDPENDTVQYRFGFGTAQPMTAWSSTPSATATYATNGHFDAKVQVRDLKPGGATSSVTKSLVVTVSPPIVGPRPRNSSTIVLDAVNRRVWTVNPDASTVTIIHADTNAKLAEINLSSLLVLSFGQTADPRTIALDSAGNAWVTCHDADVIAVISSGGALVGRINLPYGSAPYAVLTDAAGGVAYVTLQGRGELRRYTTSSRTQTANLSLGSTPRALALTGDGSRLLVTRFISALNRANVWDVATAGNLSLTRTINLLRDPGPDSSSNGRGILNYLSGVTISPDGQWAWVTAAKHNDEHGLFFTGLQNTENAVRASIARISMASSSTEDDSANRIDIDNSESPTGVVFSPLGTYAFVTLQGNNEIAVFDDLGIRAGETRSTKWRFQADLAPQGAVMDPQTNKIFVNNFMARNVSIHDVTPFLSQGNRTPSLTKITTVAAANETLSSVVLTGKQIFYNASLKNALGIEKMSRDTYISCASCHVDGSMDGRTWDFTQRGEGIRNTTDLRGRAGMGHGQVHWSGNFDEIQDFENDIRSHFGGLGLINATAASSPLGTPKTGLSLELDALAAYVSSLGKATYPKSPHRNADGSMTTAAIAGQTVFESQSCVDCHGGAKFTNSRGGVGVVPRLENVGTLRTTSGSRLEEFLAGIDTPTLLGLHDTAPYLHDGSAATLADVFRIAGGTVLQAEDGQMAGAVERPGYISQNWGNQVHKGQLAYFDSGAGSLTFSNVNGGPVTGIGALEFRFSAGTGTQNYTVTINGVAQSMNFSGEQLGWQANSYVSRRLENLTFTAGTTNTIVISKVGGVGSIALDDITVTTASNLAKAEPHRRVRQLSTADQSNLVAYLQQLDGSSAAAPERSSAAIANFRTAQMLNSGGSQDAATPAGDGVANLLKYAFNMIGGGTAQRPAVTQPNAQVLVSGGSAGLPWITVDTNGFLVVTYIRRTALGQPGVTYAVQFSSTLANGSWAINPSAVTQITAIDATFERVSVRDTIAAPRRFARVTVVAEAGLAPIIISPTSANVSQGQPFSYSIAASDGPSSYSATSLPAGLALNPITGLITGTPTQTGIFVVNVSATNPAGTTTTQVTINVNLLPPVISSPLTASGTTSTAFSYQITATQFVSTYSSSGLPPGLSLNTATGLISGTPTLDGSFNATIGVTNSAASDSKTLVITVIFDARGATVGLRQDYWTGVGGGSVANLTSLPAYPASPTGTGIIPRFRATNWSSPTVNENWADNYGQRLRGFITAPVTGNYVFWIASDDESQLWLSTNDQPTNRVLIASNATWTSTDEWNKFATQRSSANAFSFNGGAAGVVRLIAGQRYYVEALHKEGAGGDHLSVGWRLPTDPAGSTPSQIIPTSVLTPTL